MFLSLLYFGTFVSKEQETTIIWYTVVDIHGWHVKVQDGFEKYPREYQKAFKLHNSVSNIVDMLADCYYYSRGRSPSRRPNSNGAGTKLLCFPLWDYEVTRKVTVTDYDYNLQCILFIPVALYAHACFSGPAFLPSLHLTKVFLGLKL